VPYVSFATSGFCLSVCLFVRHASVFRISLSNFVYKATCEVDIRYEVRENGYDESSTRGAPLRTVVALHAMYDTVHHALINRYTHTVEYVLSKRTAYLVRYWLSDGLPTT
jgi:hypothetical protein